MGKKRATPPPPSRTTAVTLERASRLYRLIHLLGKASRTRAVILRQLKIDIRTFYRDLQLLRDCDVVVELRGNRYQLGESAAAVADRLPFPDPGLTLGEARVLAKGRSPVHKKLRRLLDQIVG